MEQGGDVRLYRRGAALALVREFLIREEQDGLLQSRRSPVIVFAGPGKSALLTELARRLEQNAPCARIDCEDFAGGARELLSLLAFELNRRSGRYRELPFPRLITGLIAIRKVDLTDLDLDADRDAARARVRQVLEDRQNTAGLLQDTVSEIVQAGFDALGSGPPAVTKAAADMARRIGPRLVLGSLAATRSGRKIILGTGQDWYGHQDRALGRYSLDVLVDLNRMASRAASRGVTGGSSPRGSQEDRREVAGLLWAAFLADLDAAFSGRRAVNWTFNCLALLDNADAPAGREFLAELVAARRERAADPLTVVATSRGDLAYQLVPRGEKITPLAARGAPPKGRWWYPVLLPDLTVTDAGTMVGRLDLPPGVRRGSITSAVYRYTEGHPVAVRMLVDAIGAQTTEAPDIDLAAVLDAPAPGIHPHNPPGPEVSQAPRQAASLASPSLADVMLRRLLRDIPAEQVADLVTCSAARDREAALRLGAESGLLGQTWSAEAEIFGATFWRERRSAGRAELHPALRRLLLRRLAARPGKAKANWTVVNAWLRANALAADDETGALYHALALGEVEHVGRRLAEAVETTGAESWLRLLEAVCAAPNNLDPRRKTVDEVGALTKWADPRDLPTAPAGRAAAAMWIDADPLSDRHRPGLRQEIRADLHQIAPFSREGIGVIREYADKVYADTPSADDQGGTEPGPASFVPPKSRRGIRRTRRARLLAAASAIVVVAGAAAGIYTAVSGSGGPVSCAPAQGSFQVFMDGGECVGVTDGSFIFDPGTTADNRGIADAEQKIAAENNAVVAGKQGYVTVALLTVLTRPPASSTTPSDVTLSRIDDELRGAYLAQYHANHELGLHPQIRLLLANEGSGEQGWQADWNQLRSLPATGTGELVAVTGMGLSVQQTVVAARTIGGAGIPMFGAVTTADGLDNTTSSLLDQVVPNVSDEVTALAGYLPRPARSVLVYDRDTTDLYTKSLREDFMRAFGPSLRAGVGEIPYVPSTLDSPLFKKIAQDLCAVTTPPLVFYAGRNSVFDQFVSQLEQEGDCNAKSLEIVTGGDADGLRHAATAGTAGGAQVSVVYTDIENPATLTTGFEHDFQTLLGRANDPSMTDPWLLASYDAVTAAANAIADAEGDKSDPAQVTASDVAPWADLLNRSAAVAGATGTLQISSGGDLENPQIPIVQLAAGKATTLTVVK